MMVDRRLKIIGMPEPFGNLPTRAHTSVAISLVLGMGEAFYLTSQYRLFLRNDILQAVQMGSRWI